MKLAGKVCSVIEPEVHGRGQFALVSVRIDAHPAAKENPYVIGIHAEPHSVKLEDPMEMTIGEN